MTSTSRDWRESSMSEDLKRTADGWIDWTGEQGSTAQGEID